MADADARRRRTNEAVMRTESDMKLYVEKILTNLTSAMTMIEAVKAQQAPKVEMPQQPAPAPAPAAEVPAEEEPAAEAEAPAEEAAEELSAEETAPEAPEEAPAEATEAKEEKE